MTNITLPYNYRYNVEMPYKPGPAVKMYGDTYVSSTDGKKFYIRVIFTNDSDTVSADFHAEVVFLDQLGYELTRSSYHVYIERTNFGRANEKHFPVRVLTLNDTQAEAFQSVRVDYKINNPKPLFGGNTESGSHTPEAGLGGLRIE